MELAWAFFMVDEVSIKEMSILGYDEEGTGNNSIHCDKEAGINLLY